MIQDARVYAQTDVVFVGIILFTLVGKLSDSAVRLVERRFLDGITHIKADYRYLE
ncbi:hypothetical protein Q0F98_37085 [Paenibacillus amylolyticus]|nr:hypothetical protein Q0F98_37085 [Paenibacillus amylolyticus]